MNTRLLTIKNMVQVKVRCENPSRCNKRREGYLLDLTTRPEQTNKQTNNNEKNFFTLYREHLG